MLLFSMSTISSTCDSDRLVIDTDMESQESQQADPDVKTEAADVTDGVTAPQPGPSQGGPSQGPILLGKVLPTGQDYIPSDTCEVKYDDVSMESDEDCIITGTDFQLEVLSEHEDDMSDCHSGEEEGGEAGYIPALPLTDFTPTTMDDLLLRKPCKFSVVKTKLDRFIRAPGEYGDEYHSMVDRLEKLLASPTMNELIAGKLDDLMCK